MQEVSVQKLETCVPNFNLINNYMGFIFKGTFRSFSESVFKIIKKKKKPSMPKIDAGESLIL